jgi:hypothetical protein
MVLHGMRIKVKDTLSQPNEEDMQAECKSHGGVEAVYTSVRASHVHDELQLLRLRHKLGHESESNNFITKPREVDMELARAARSSSTGTSGEVQPDRPMYSPQQDAAEIEKQLANFSLDRFEGDYIELDAGEHEAILQQVADDMKKPGHYLNTLAEDLKERATVHKHLNPELQVQEPVVKLANALARRFFFHSPGSWEDDDGEIHPYAEAGDVFSFRGQTYIKLNNEEPDDFDGPKPDLLPIPDALLAYALDFADEAPQDQKTQQTWIGQNKPDIINNYFQGRALPKTGVTWSQVNMCFEVRSEARFDCCFSLIQRIHGYQVRDIPYAASRIDKVRSSCTTHFAARTNKSSTLAPREKSSL